MDSSQIKSNHLFLKLKSNNLFLKYRSADIEVQHRTVDIQTLLGKNEHLQKIVMKNIKNAVFNFVLITSPDILI